MREGLSARSGRRDRERREEKGESSRRIEGEKGSESMQAVRERGAFICNMSADEWVRVREEKLVHI